MSLSIVIPAYNERARLPLTLERIHAFFLKASPAALHEIIIVDDGSNDDTAHIAQEWKDRLPIRAMRLDRNRGKGAASRTGMLAATGEEILLYDADGATPIGEVTKLLAASHAGADIAIGSRLGENGMVVVMAWYRRLIGRTYHWLASRLTGNIRDAACGCKLFRREAAQVLFREQRIDRFAFDVEILWLALCHGYTVAEVPVHWEAIPFSKVRVVRDGIQMFACVVGLYVRSWFGK